MANPSQCLEEGAGRWPPRPPGPYSEAQRLALEELVAGGPEALRAFLRREQLPPFLSEPEVQAIARGALPPAAAAEPAGEPSLGASLDASSLTYFPERSDLEPPALELGWPGFASGAFRGLTRVEAHFQPGGGESLYGCKEAVRRQIRSARQVGARPRRGAAGARGCGPYGQRPPKAPSPGSFSRGSTNRSENRQRCRWVSPSGDPKQDQLVLKSPSSNNTSPGGQARKYTAAGTDPNSGRLYATPVKSCLPGNIAPGAVGQELPVPQHCGQVPCCCSWPNHPLV